MLLLLLLSPTPITGLFKVYVREQAGVGKGLAACRVQLGKAAVAVQCGVHHAHRVIVQDLCVCVRVCVCTCVCVCVCVLPSAFIPHCQQQPSEWSGYTADGLLHRPAGPGGPEGFACCCCCCCSIPEEESAEALEGAAALALGVVAGCMCVRVSECYALQSSLLNCTKHALPKNVLVQVYARSILPH